MIKPINKDLKFFTLESKTRVEFVYEDGWKKVNELIVNDRTVIIIFMKDGQTLFVIDINQRCFEPVGVR